MSDATTGKYVGTQVRMGRPPLTVAELAARTTSYCSRCKQHLPISEFNFDNSRPPMNLSSKCKACIREYNKEYREKNREKIRQNDADYYIRNSEAIKERVRDYIDWNREKHNQASLDRAKSNPEKVRVYKLARRARKANVLSIPYTSDQLSARMSMWDGLCWICLKEPWTTVDHVKPLAVGGPDILSNLRSACKSCNSSKRYTWPFTVKGR